MTILINSGRKSILRKGGQNRFSLPKLTAMIQRGSDIILFLVVIANGSKNIDWPIWEQLQNQPPGLGDS